jgi:hypothetical protein
VCPLRWLVDPPGLLRLPSRHARPVRARRRPATAHVNVTEFLAELGATVNLPSAACRGRHELFDSRNPSDVASAQKICASCPALQACRQWVETSPRHLHGYVVAGQAQRRVRPRERKPSPVPPVSAMRQRVMEAIPAHEARTQARNRANFS